MNMIVLMITLALAIFGGPILKKFIKKMEASEQFNDRLSDKKSIDSYYVSSAPAPPVDQILLLWGKRGAGEVGIEDMDEDTLNLLKSYEFIGPDKYGPYISRKSVKHSKDCQGFIQIGIWGDGTELLVKKGKSDPGIYIQLLEGYSTSASPELLARSVEDLLKCSWQYHSDSQNVELAWYNRLWVKLFAKKK